MVTLWEASSQESPTRLQRLQIQRPLRLVENRRRLDGEEDQSGMGSLFAIFLAVQAMASALAFAPAAGPRATSAPTVAASETPCP
jgi:hypothetical protein